jgi:hypothetical protein
VPSHGGSVTLSDPKRSWPEILLAEPSGYFPAVPTRSGRAGQGAPDRVLTVNLPAKITCDRSMQQTRDESHARRGQASDQVSQAGAATQATGQTKGTPQHGQML